MFAAGERLPAAVDSRVNNNNYIISSLQKTTFLIKFQFQKYFTNVFFESARSRDVSVRCRSDCACAEDNTNRVETWPPSLCKFLRLITVLATLLYIEHKGRSFSCLYWKQSQRLWKHHLCSENHKWVVISSFSGTKSFSLALNVQSRYSIIPGHLNYQIKISCVLKVSKIQVGNEHFKPLTRRCNKWTESELCQMFSFLLTPLSVSLSTCPRACWSSRWGSTSRSNGGRSGSPWRRRRRTRRQDTRASAGGFFRSRRPGDRRQFRLLHSDVVQLKICCFLSETTSYYMTASCLNVCTL